MNIKFQAYLLHSLLHQPTALGVGELLSQLSATSNRRLWIVEDDAYKGDNAQVDLSQVNTLWKLIQQEVQRFDGKMRQLSTTLGRMPSTARPLGSVHLCANDDEIHLHFDRNKLAPILDEWRFGNYVSLRLNLSDVFPAASCAQSLFKGGTFEYGYVCDPDEYAELNLDTSLGVEAVGLDVSKFLPGFYWGNYFSESLCERINFSPEGKVPGCRVVRLDGGVLIFNLADPDRWREAEFVSNADAAIECIGKHWFFKKGRAQNDVRTRLYSPRESIETD